MISLLTVGQISFLVIVPVVVLGILGVVIFVLVRRKRMTKSFKYFYYKHIYKIAMDKDYYLINNFLFKIDDSHVARIDHILFADKYIYLINDFYFPGDITGKENDKSIILIDKKGKKVYSDNPVDLNKRLTNKLSLITGISPSMLIGISVINDDCRCGIALNSKSFYIIQSKRIKALVKAIESRDIGNINQEQLAAAVKAIDKLNRRNRRVPQK